MKRKLAYILGLSVVLAGMLYMVMAPTFVLAADLGGPSIKDSPKAAPKAQASVKDNPPATLNRMFGCYGDVGASLGVMITDFKFDGGKIPASPNGLFGQLGAGCDAAVAPRWVAGVWGFYNIGEINTKFNAGGDSVNYDLAKNWALGARFGYMVQETTLLYGRIGYTAAEATVGSGADKLERSLSGMVLGAGVETLIAGPLALRFGVDHYRWGDEKLNDVKATSNMWTGTTSLVFKF